MPVWELNYADREALRPALIPRCKEAVRKFLLYTQGGGGSPSPARVAWCTDNLANLSQLANEMSDYITSEPTFIAGGTSITDAALQSRIENVLTTYYMPA